MTHAASNLVNIRIKPERHLLGVVPIKLFGSGTIDKSAVFVATRYISTPKFVVKRQKKELCHKESLRSDPYFEVKPKQQRNIKKGLYIPEDLVTAT